MPQISFIVPVYNAESMLPSCLNSFLKQTYDDFEVILIDDGSKDGSFKVMSQYSDSDKRFTSYTKQNGGVSSARNYGLAHATGKWIAFVDSDDWIAPDFCEKMLTCAQENSLDVVICRRIDEKDDGSEYQQVTQKEHLRVLSFDEFLPNEEDFYGTCWGFLFKREIMGNVKFDEKISFTEDALFSLEVMQNAKRIGILNEHLYHYNLRIHPSLSQGKFNEKKYTILESRKKQAELFRNTAAKEMMLGRLADACYALYDMGQGDRVFMKQYYPEVNRVFRHHFQYWNKWRGGSGIKKALRARYLISLHFGFCITKTLQRIKALKS